MVCSYLDTSPNILFGSEGLFFFQFLCFQEVPRLSKGEGGYLHTGLPKGRESCLVTELVLERLNTRVGLLSKRTHTLSWTCFAQLRPRQTSTRWSTSITLTNLSVSSGCAYHVSDKDRGYPRLNSFTEDMSPDTELSSTFRSDVWSRTPTQSSI